MAISNSAINGFSGTVMLSSTISVCAICSHTYPFENHHSDGRKQIEELGTPLRGIGVVKPPTRPAPPVSLSIWCFMFGANSLCHRNLDRCPPHKPSTRSITHEFECHRSSITSASTRRISREVTTRGEEDLQSSRIPSTTCASFSIMWAH